MLDLSDGMAKALRGAGVRVERVVIMEGKSHTDPILEDPAGGVDPLMEELIGIVRGVGGGAGNGWMQGLHHTASDTIASPRRSRVLSPNKPRFTSPEKSQGRGGEGGGGESSCGCGGDVVLLPKRVNSRMLSLARWFNPF